MKLFDILSSLDEATDKVGWPAARKRSSRTEHTYLATGIDRLIEPADGYYGNFDVVVTYELQPASYSDHPYQDTTAREHHPAEIDILTLVADDKIQMFNSNDEVIKEFEKGYDIEKLPGFKPKEHLQYFTDEVMENS